MNMLGIIAPRSEQAPPETMWNRLRAWIVVRRMLLLVVVLPTALIAIYYFAVASNQYESEAHYIVRAANDTPTPGLGVSQVLSAATGLSAAQSEAMSVADYLTSHDVVAALQKDVDLIGLFQRPGIDPVSRLHGSNPTPERLLKYFRSQVSVNYNTETGITTVRVRTFRPGDSFAVIQRLLKSGERRVNVLNERSYRDTLADAQKRLAETEDALATAQTRLTSFRQNRNDIDPQASGEAQITLVSKLTAELSNTRAALATMSRTINHSSPQYVALQEHVRSLDGQLAAQSGRLTGGGRAIATDIGSYEELRLRQGFLAKRYEAAAASLEKARETAQRQQLYLVPVVEPNMPVKSLYPERWRIVITALVALLLVYAIGWLIAAGVREHAS